MHLAVELLIRFGNGAELLEGEAATAVSPRPIIVHPLQAMIDYIWFRNWPCRGQLWEIFEVEKFDFEI